LTPNTGFNSRAHASNRRDNYGRNGTKSAVDPALTRIISVVAAPQLAAEIECSLSKLIIYTATIDEAKQPGFIVLG